MRLRPLYPALFLLLCSAELLHAGGGAWVRTASGYYFKIGFTSLTADNEYGLEGENQPLFRDTARFANGTIGISNITLYSEYGLTDWLTSVISTHYSVIVREADVIERGMEGLVETESASGLADIWLGGRVRILPKEWKVAGAATLSCKVPTGSPHKEVPLGTGVIDYEGGLAFGTGFPVGANRFGYAQVSGSYRLRNNAENEYLWQIEAGVQLLPTLGVQGVLDGTHSTADFEQAAMAVENSMEFNQLVGNQTFTRFSSGLSYDLSDQTELSLLYATTLSGMNTLNSGAISVGIAWKQ